MKCDHCEYHDDMYPEFAPDPIIVKCGEKAVGFMLKESNLPPDPGDEDESPLEARVFCQRHLILNLQQDDDQFSSFISAGFFGSIVQLRKEWVTVKEVG